MTIIERARAMWMAFPAAPETRRLKALRFQFLVATGLLLVGTLLPSAAWHAHRHLCLLMPPLGLGVILTSGRYFAAKIALDERYRQDRIAALDVPHPCAAGPTDAGEAAR